MSGVVIDLFGLHGPDHTEVIGVFCEVRKQRTDFHSRLSVLGKIAERAARLERYSLKLCQLLACGDGVRKGLAVQAPELGFPVECFQMGRAACHAEENDPLGAGGDMGCLKQSGCCRRSVPLSLKCGQCEGAHAQNGVLQECAAGNEGVRHGVQRRWIQ